MQEDGESTDLAAMKDKIAEMMEAIAAVTATGVPVMSLVTTSNISSTIPRARWQMPRNIAHLEQRHFWAGLEPRVDDDFPEVLDLLESPDDLSVRLPETVETEESSSIRVSRSPLTIVGPVQNLSSYQFNQSRSQDLVSRLQEQSAKGRSKL